jgi:FtsH-binding integral membrane protein
MADQFSRTGIAGIDRVGFDAGLRAHMQRVFNYMGGGLVLTGLIAFIVANTPLAGIIFGSPLKFLVMFAPLVFLMFGMNFNSMTAAQAQTRFWTFCGLMGLSMAIVFLVFTGASVARAFFITGATFGAMSLYGYTTKRDLTAMGAFMMMGILGLFIAGIVNIFLMSSMMQWVVSVAGVVIFTGLTAYQVQTIKQTYAESAGQEANDKLAVWGALSLYLSFINLFQYILQLTGTVRRS